MASLRTLLLSGALMASGAGLFAGAQHLRAGAHPSAAAESVETPAAAAALRPVVVVADPRAAGEGREEVAALSRRMAGIEAKLDTLAASVTRDPPGDEVLTRPPADRTPEQQYGMDAASQIVDAAVSRGTWLDADQSRMRELRAGLLPADRFALKAKLAVAANEGKLRSLAGHPFFF